MKLTIAARLRSLVEEHRARTPQLVPLTAQHAVGDHRANHSRRSLRAQRQILSTLRLEAVHLLADDIGEFTDGTPEERGLLHDGHTHLFVPVSSHYFSNGFLEVLPGADFTRQDVIHAPDGLDLLRQDQPPSATGFARTTWPERLMEN